MCIRDSISGRFLINRAGQRLDANGDPIVLPNEDLNEPDFDNSLPGLDFASFVLEDDTLTNSPYEANFAPGHLSGWESDDDDQMFGPLELERLLRPSDADSNQLPGRLVDLMPMLASNTTCLLYTSPSPRDQRGSRMPSSA